MFVILAALLVIIGIVLFLVGMSRRPRRDNQLTISGAILAIIGAIVAVAILLDRSGG